MTLRFFVFPRRDSILRRTTDRDREREAGGCAFAQIRSAMYNRLANQRASNQHGW
jgi:hypothetical protein